MLQVCNIKRFPPCSCIHQMFFLWRIQQILYTNNTEAARKAQNLGGLPMKSSEILYTARRNQRSDVRNVLHKTVLRFFQPLCTFSTSMYLDDFLNIYNSYFEGMISQIYPLQLQLNKANTTDTEAPFFRFASF